MNLELYENVLGGLDGSDDVDKKAKDALGEFMNIMCGNSLTSIFGAEASINMSVPEIKEINGSDINMYIDSEDCIKFLVDEHPFLILLNKWKGE